MKGSDFSSEAARAWAVDAAAAICFLTRVPLQSILPEPLPPLSRSMRAFPLAGLVVGGIGALAFALLAALAVPPLATAAIALAVMALATGALHEDGLADMADGFGGGATRERKLAIMRDSHTGTFGAVTLILVALIKAASLGSLDWHAAPWVIMASAILSRSAIVWLMGSLPPARPDGLAAGAGQPDSATVTTALVLGGILSFLLLLIAGGLGTVVAAILAAGLAAFAIQTLARHQIGGQTGDVCGATQAIAEAAMLVAAAATLS